MNSLGTFQEFLSNNKKEYLFPVGLPIIVFIASYFGTNIGWRAVPMGIIVTIIMTAMTTLKMYNRWYAVESIMKSIKAASIRRE